tara:strand:- start:2136 stop:2507 length:372 start_codon:yes stop_codon:yes gene_type:complete
MSARYRDTLQIGELFELVFNWRLSDNTTPINLENLTKAKIDFKTSINSNTVMSFNLGNGIYIDDATNGKFSLKITLKNQQDNNLNNLTYMVGDLVLLFENGDSKVPVRLELDILKSITDISDL